MFVLDKLLRAGRLVVKAVCERGVEKLTFEENVVRGLQQIVHIKHLVFVLSLFEQTRVGGGSPEAVLLHVLVSTAILLYLRVFLSEFADGDLYEAGFRFFSDFPEQHLDQTFLGLSLEVPPASAFHDFLLVESEEVHAEPLQLLSVVRVGYQQDLQHSLCGHETLQVGAADLH